MWDPANKAKPLAVTDVSSAIIALSWHPHGLAIAAATTDGTVHVIRPQP
jgi:YD repeat-containing protein